MTGNDRTVIANIRSINHLAGRIARFFRGLSTSPGEARQESLNTFEDPSVLCDKGDPGVRDCDARAETGLGSITTCGCAFGDHDDETGPEMVGEAVAGAALVCSDCGDGAARVAAASG